ncbi:MAG: hypothetical protein ACTSPY_13415 [Candidatus Helarchaeota archaeon]
MKEEDDLREKSRKILLDENNISKPFLNRVKYWIINSNLIIPSIFIILIIFVYIVYIISLFFFNNWSSNILMLNFLIMIECVGCYLIFFNKNNSCINNLRNELITYLLSIQNDFKLLKEDSIPIYSIIEGRPVLLLKTHDIKKQIGNNAISYPSKTIEHISDFGYIIKPVGMELIEKIEKNSLEDIYNMENKLFNKKILRFLKLENELVENIHISKIQEGYIEINIKNNKFLNSIRNISEELNVRSIIYFPICNFISILLVRRLKHQLIVKNIDINYNNMSIVFDLLIGNKI